MAFDIGSARPSQFPAILNFWEAATELPSATDDLPGLSALWERDPDAFVIASVEGDIVGTLLAAWDGWRGAFYRLAVHPDYRRHGLGRSLVAEGERRLRQRGVRRINLYVVEAHPAAMGFWPALGYLLDAEEVRFVKNVTPE
ncbi:MAG TPA: GNAT family N-acetyltransferase [Acidimicrobiales bacterium]|jgi:ribosomal protein S18 acetylase RimI-like enzyme|nr:GNAT family N-acetyltransferase [Acidimicrobiales bacterium]